MNSIPGTVRVTSPKRTPAPTKLPTTGGTVIELVLVRVKVPRASPWWGGRTITESRAGRELDGPGRMVRVLAVRFRTTAVPPGRKVTAEEAENACPAPAVMVTGSPSAGLVLPIVGLAVIAGAVTVLVVDRV